MKSLTPKLKQNLHILLIYQFYQQSCLSLSNTSIILEESVLKNATSGTVNAGALILVGYDFDLAS
jgi:hypothetical protein